jgi:hypothetical protein
MKIYTVLKSGKNTFYSLFLNDILICKLPKIVVFGKGREVFFTKIA